MTRQIKFRAWDKGNNQFCYLDISRSSEADIEGLGIFRNVEKQQFIGLLDKNGQEIYEGDIVQPIQGQPFEIKWMITNTDTDGVFVGFYDFTGSDFKLLEIIGNIYSNPELLK